jgi:hypothetical protein
MVECASYVAFESALYVLSWIYLWTADQLIVIFRYTAQMAQFLRLLEPKICLSNVLEATERGLIRDQNLSISVLPGAD